MTPEKIKRRTLSSSLTYLADKVISEEITHADRIGLAITLQSLANGLPPGLLDCGLCFEENGEECHPHPECTR